MDGQSWGEFMFHIADCQSTWPQCGRRKRKRLRESERREEKEEENIGEGGIGSLSWPTTRSPEPNKRTIVSSLAAKAHDLLVARDRGRAAGGQGEGSGKFVATFLQLQLQRATIEMHINMRFLQCLHIRLAS